MQAELANTTAIPSLKQEVAQYRHLIETVVKKAIELGHESHLKKYVSHSRSPIYIFFAFHVWGSFHIAPVRPEGGQRRHNNRRSIILMHAIIKEHRSHFDSIKHLNAWRASAAAGHVNDIDLDWLTCHLALGRNGLWASLAACAGHTCRPKNLLTCQLAWPLLQSGIFHTKTDRYSRLGENPFTMAALQSLLADRITAGDIDGSLVISILKVRLSSISCKSQD